MRVFIANFGRENYEWPVCLATSSIATMNEIDMHPFWVAGDREGFIARAQTRKTAAGITPPKPVASRWFNLMTVIAESSGDTWIHRAKDEFWWTVSTEQPATFQEQVEPTANADRVIVCHKPCQPWSDRNKRGNPLRWNGLHPKAKEFLFTEGTLQQLSADNAAYALALLAGDSLDPWHDRVDWRKKATANIGKGGAGKVFSGRERAATRMAMQAFATAATSNGQIVSKTLKNKDVLGFKTQRDLEVYLLQLIDAQQGLCMITDLPMQNDGEQRGGSGNLNRCGEWSFCLTAARMAAEQERR